MAKLQSREIAGKPRCNAGQEPMASRFGFLEAASPNAFADIVDGVHFASLNRGLVDIFNYLGNEIYVPRRVLDVAAKPVMAPPSA